MLLAHFQEPLLIRFFSTQTQCFHVSDSGGGVAGDDSGSKT